MTYLRHHREGVLEKIYLYARFVGLGVLFVLGTRSGGDVHSVALNNAHPTVIDKIYV